MSARPKRLLPAVVVSVASKLRSHPGGAKQADVEPEGQLSSRTHSLTTSGVMYGGALPEPGLGAEPRADVDDEREEHHEAGQADDEEDDRLAGLRAQLVVEPLAHCRRTVASLVSVSGNASDRKGMLLRAFCD